MDLALNDMLDEIAEAAVAGARDEAHALARGRAVLLLLRARAWDRMYRAACDRLERSPRSPLARGMAEEAVAGVNTTCDEFEAAVSEAWDVTS